MEIATYLNEQRQRVEEHLAALMLHPVGDFRKHIESMRYSLFAGGKRIRPILCLAAACRAGSAERPSATSDAPSRSRRSTARWKAAGSERNVSADSSARTARKRVHFVRTVSAS